MGRRTSACEQGQKNFRLLGADVPRDAQSADEEGQRIRVNNDSVAQR
jgi:hypothetical protein